MIQGVTITIMTKTEAGKDDFNRQLYTETAVTVENVLIGQPTTQEITETLDLYGKRVEYWLGIPKEDANDWTDIKVVLPEPFAGTYRTFGFPVAGIPAHMPPLPWNKKGRVERIG